MSAEKKLRDNVRRRLLGGGKKLCNTIILEDDTEAEDDSINKTQSTGRNPTVYEDNTILIAETDSEDEEVIGASGGTSSSSVITKSKEGEIKQLEQSSTIKWELPCFMMNFENYMDNESKYQDENEVTATRTSLIQTGDSIGISSVFLANLYMGQHLDENQNRGDQVNLNLPEGASYVTSRRKSVEDIKNMILFTVTLKLVNHSVEDPCNVHFGVNVETECGEKLLSFVHLFTNIDCVGGALSEARAIDKKLFSKMQPDEKLLITVNCSVYRPILEWGLSSEQMNDFLRFAELRRIPKTYRKSVSLAAVDLSSKCANLGLKGIAECLNSIIPKSLIDEH